MAVQSRRKKYLVVMLGDDGVGKTALVNQFCQQGFIEEHEQTIYDYFDVPSHPMQIIDVGNEYLRIDNEYLNDADGFVVVYDIRSLASFKKAGQILSDMQQTRNPPIVLVGNKIDDERTREVSIQDGKRLARDRRCRFCEVTAKRNGSTRSVFDAMLHLLEERRTQTEPVETDDSDPEPEMRSLASFFTGCCGRR